MANRLGPSCQAHSHNACRSRPRKYFGQRGELRQSISRFRTSLSNLVLFLLIDVVRLPALYPPLCSCTGHPRSRIGCAHRRLLRRCTKYHGLTALASSIRATGKAIAPLRIHAPLYHTYTPNRGPCISIYPSFAATIIMVFSFSIAPCLVAWRAHTWVHIQTVRVVHATLSVCHNLKCQAFTFEIKARTSAVLRIQAFLTQVVRLQRRITTAG